MGYSIFSQIVVCGDWNMNIADVVIIIIVGVMLFCALRHIYKAKKNKGCTCGCDGCTAPCAAMKKEE